MGELSALGWKSKVVFFMTGENMIMEVGKKRKR
jgi:hypothetical protein